MPGKCLIALSVIALAGCLGPKPIELPKELPLSSEIASIVKRHSQDKIDQLVKHKVNFNLAFVDAKSSNSACADAESVGFHADWVGSPMTDYIMVDVDTTMIPSVASLERAIKQVRQIAKANGGVHESTYVVPLNGEG